MKIFLLRFFRRLRHAFRFKEIYTWKGESCQRCGSCYKINISLSDLLWDLVSNDKYNLLCPECFFDIAQNKGIRIEKNDIERLFVLNPEYSSSFLSLIYRNKVNSGPFHTIKEVIDDLDKEYNEKIDKGDLSFKEIIELLKK